MLTLAREHTLADFANHHKVFAADGLVGSGSRSWVRLSVGGLRRLGFMASKLILSCRWLRAQDTLKAQVPIRNTDVAWPWVRIHCECSPAVWARGELQMDRGPQRCIPVTEDLTSSAEAITTIPLVQVMIFHGVLI